jgi:hypothetical protein
MRRFVERAGKRGRLCEQGRVYLPPWILRAPRDGESAEAQQDWLGSAARAVDSRQDLLNCEQIQRRVHIVLAGRCKDRGEPQSFLIHPMAELVAREGEDAVQTSQSISKLRRLRMRGAGVPLVIGDHGKHLSDVQFIARGGSDRASAHRS